MTHFHKILATYPEDSEQYQLAKRIVFWKKEQSLKQRLIENSPRKATESIRSHAIESGRRYVPLTIKSLLRELLP